jgi:ribosome biogenesis GTPase A
MSIQWFPGHMHLTRQAIAERVKSIDVVIEMLDARLPGSSANPLMQQLTSGRPTLKVLGKQDMADPACTALWLAHYNAQPHTQAIALDASMSAPARALIDACHRLAPHRGGMVKPMRVLICGIPNVGKSTLINTLKGKRAAKTGDEAGVTRTESRIALADDFYLYDTPGMLWPRIIVPESGFNLAASGAVGKNAYDEEEVACELLAHLKNHYPQLMEARYRFGLSPELLAQTHDDVLLEHIARQCGALTSGGRVNLQKAAERVIADFRGLHIGRITLETPDQFTRWLKAGQRADAERAVRKNKLREDGHIGPARKPKVDQRKAARKPR